MEAETFLSRGYGVRIGLKAKEGWLPLSAIARVWQPSRLKGIQVSSEVGTPFLAATQVFDYRPIPRKWLALARTQEAPNRFVSRGTMLVTCSGAVGRATLAFEPHLGNLITHDLLRIEPLNILERGWLYAYLRAPKVRAMMTSAHYGHVIKHLEIAHLTVLPIPSVHDRWLRHFENRVQEILRLRDAAHAATLTAETYFEKCVGSLKPRDRGEEGFVIKSSATIFRKARRLDAARHQPIVQRIIAGLSADGRILQPLETCGYSVWVPGRYKRIPASDGVEFLDSSDLFEINPDTPKRFADCRFGDEFRGRVQAGWLLLASSGQTYGLVGGAVLASDFYNNKVLANHVIRIAPRKNASARPGYLLTALTHPIFGRPLVKSFAFGSSVPEISPEDIKSFPVVRLQPRDEEKIAALAESSAESRGRGDLVENEIAREAEAILDRFLTGDTSDLRSN